MSEKIHRTNNYNYDDNKELIKRAKNGDNAALDYLTEMNLPLVSSISKKFLNHRRCLKP